MSVLLERAGKTGRPLFDAASGGAGSETTSQGNLNVGGAGNFLGNVYMYGTLDLGSYGTNPNVRFNVGGPSAGTSIETAPVMQLSRPAQSGIKNTNSAGFSVGAFEPGILGRTRLDVKLSGLPTDSNTYGTIPDVTVMSMLADGRVGIGTTNPVSKLEVNGGNVAITNGTLKVTGAGVNTATSVFIHVVTNANQCGAETTVIDNPYANGDPNAILMVTQNRGTLVPFSTPVAPGYFWLTYGDVQEGCALAGPGLNRWMINTETGVMLVGARFNVMVIKP